MFQVEWGADLERRILTIARILQMFGDMKELSCKVFHFIKY